VTRRQFLYNAGTLAGASATAGAARAGQSIAAPPNSAPPPVGYVVYGRDHLDVVEQIAALRRDRFSAVGFHTAPSLAPSRAFDPFSASSDSVERLRCALSGFKKVEVHGPFSDWDISLVSPNLAVTDASLHELERHIQFAKSVGASVFTTHPGTTAAPISPESQLGRLRDSLERLAEIGRANGLLICVETADILVNAPNLRVFDGINSDYLGITLDTGHVSLHAAGITPGYAPYRSIEECIAALGRHIRHVHLNDYNSKRDHIGIGQGELPLKGVLAALHRGGYQGFFDMEVDPTLVPAENMPAQRKLVEGLLAEVWN